MSERPSNMHRFVDRSSVPFRSTDKTLFDNRRTVIARQQRRLFKSWPTNDQTSDRVSTLESGLYVVATPIGNLEDITFRAVRVLKSVSCVYAEDTRRTLKLLNAFGISTPLISCHEHNEADRVHSIVTQIANGQVRNKHAPLLP